MALDNAEAFKNVDFRPPRFVSHIAPSGLLPDVAGAHACWYYCRCAIQSLKRVDQGADYANEVDHQNMLHNLARSVALLYRLDSPDNFLIFLDFVKAEALIHQLEWDERIESPALDPFVKRGN